VKFVVQPRNALSTSYHPDRSANPLEDLADYLRYEFDPDRAFRLRKNSVTVTLSASLVRRSTWTHWGEGRGLIAVNLQPTIDVAAMVQHYWRSQVWPARVMFDLVAILGQTFFANGMHRARRFVHQFGERRLDQLISESLVAARDAPSPSPLLYSRADMFGQLSEKDLAKQLAVFLIFHEVGHFVACRRATQQQEAFSVEEEKDELQCDDFACDELSIAYGESLGIEFLECVPFTVFLLIFLCTVAEHLPALHVASFRAATFRTVLRRARAATVHVHRFGHRKTPPSHELEMDALRHFPIFEAMMDILDRFFTEAASPGLEVFDDSDPGEEDGMTPPQASSDLPDDRSVAGAIADWQMIWDREDTLALERARVFESLYESRKHRPRSRPMFSMPILDESQRKPNE